MEFYRKLVGLQNEQNSSHNPNSITSPANEQKGMFQYKEMTTGMRKMEHVFCRQKSSGLNYEEGRDYLQHLAIF